MKLTKGRLGRGYDAVDRCRQCDKPLKPGGTLYIDEDNANAFCSVQCAHDHLFRVDDWAARDVAAAVEALEAEHAQDFKTDRSTTIQTQSALIQEQADAIKATAQALTPIIIGLADKAEEGALTTHRTSLAKLDGIIGLARNIGAEAGLVITADEYQQGRLADASVRAAALDEAISAGLLDGETVEQLADDRCPPEHGPGWGFAPGASKPQTQQAVGVHTKPNTNGNSRHGYLLEVPLEAPLPGGLTGRFFIESPGNNIRDLFACAPDVQWPAWDLLVGAGDFRWYAKNLPAPPA